MSNHVEFPELMPETAAAVDAGYGAASAVMAGDRNRVLFAAFLREVVNQAQRSVFGNDAGVLEQLKAIADNLHSPPPPPWTLAQAREAARKLGGQNAVIVRAFLAALGEGVQP
jgi:hypothetical protein